MPVTDDQLNNKQPKTKNAKQPSGSARESKALAAHQQFEGVAKALAGANNDRLGSLLNAVVSERKVSVSNVVDVLEAVETGELDLMLIAQEMDERRQKRSAVPTEFKIERAGFDPGIDLNKSIDCVQLVTGFSAAKAIAGV